MTPAATYIPHASRNAFRTDLDVTPLADGVCWRLDSPLGYVDDDGRVIVVPPGFVTDFASIPPLARIAAVVQAALFLFRLFVALGAFWIFAWWGLVIAAWVVVYLADDFEHEGTWDKSSALHDYLYATRCRGFFESNWILYRAMSATGEGWTAWWKRFVIWQAVNVGGIFAWRDDARKIDGRKKG